MGDLKYDNIKEWFSTEEYLNILEKSEIRAEYLNGEIRYMAGGTPVHSLISSRVNVAIATKLKDKTCNAFNSDLKIWIDKKNSYLMPDVSVVCGKIETAEKDQNAVINPTVVVEVVSESSYDYDYGTKFRLYRSIKSLHEYIIVHQDEIKVDIFSRKEDKDIWLLQSFEGERALLQISCLEIALPLSEIYEGVFDPPTKP